MPGLRTLSVSTLALVAHGFAPAARSLRRSRVAVSMSQVRSIVDRTIFQAAKGDRVNAANEPYCAYSSQVLKRPAPQGNGIGEKIDEEPMRDRLVVEWDVIKADLKVYGRSLLRSRHTMADVGVKHKQSVTHRLYLHELSSTIGLGQNSDLLLSKDGFPHLEQGDLVQLFVPEAPSRRLTLQVCWPEKQRGTNMQVSVLKSVAELFGFQPFTDVVVHGPIEPSDAEVAVTFVELHFKDQFISRGDMWRFQEAMMDLPVHRKKTFELLGMRARVEDIKRSKKPVDSGALTSRTKVIFRSRSARIFWLVQMSTAETNDICLSATSKNADTLSTVGPCVCEE